MKKATENRFVVCKRVNLSLDVYVDTRIYGFIVFTEGKRFCGFLKLHFVRACRGGAQHGVFQVNQGTSGSHVAHKETEHM